MYQFTQEERNIRKLRICNHNSILHEIVKIQYINRHLGVSQEKIEISVSKM